MRKIEPGMLCIVIGSSFPENIGKTVVVLKFEPASFGFLAGWDCESCSGDGLRGVDPISMEVTVAKTCVFLASNLLPITPDELFTAEPRVEKEPVVMSKA